MRATYVIAFYTMFRNLSKALPLQAMQALMGLGEVRLPDFLTTAL